MEREQEGTCGSAAEPACCSHLLCSSMMGTDTDLPHGDTHVHRAHSSSGQNPLANLSLNSTTSSLKLGTAKIFFSPPQMLLLIC